MELTLVCRTSGEEHHDDWSFAQLVLTRAMAKRLVAARDLFASVSDVSAGWGALYCVEFYNAKCDWGSNLENVLEFDESEGGWFSVSGDPVLKRERTGNSTMLVTRDGVLWAGQPKHCGGEFESEVITWSQLEAVARGEDPFPKIQAVTNRDLRCRECGDSMVILDNGVSHHVDGYGDVDHNQDDQHVAVAEEQVNRLVGQESNPLGYVGCRSDPTYVTESDFRRFVAYGLLSVWQSGFYQVDDMLILRRIFLQVLSDTVRGLWLGRRKPGDGALDLPGKFLTPVRSFADGELDKPVSVGWRVSLHADAVLLHLYGVPGDELPIFLDYDALTPRQDVLAVLREAGATVGEEVDPELISLANAPHK